MRRFLFLLLWLLIGTGAAAAWWLYRPLDLGTAATLELEIEPGMTPRAVARAAVQAGIRTDAQLLYAWFRLSGKDRLIRAGNYEITTGTTPQTLLDKLVRGEEDLRTLTLVEGWNWHQVRAALARESDLRHDSAALEDAALMTALGLPGVAPEGQFFPDTYTYAKGSSEMALLRRARHAMQRHLQAAWQVRSDNKKRKRK